MAEKRAAFSLRRRRSLGFSKCRWLRTTFKVPSRSIFFLRRRRALSTDSPFLSLISVNPIHFLSTIAGVSTVLDGQCSASVRTNRVFRKGEKSTGKSSRLNGLNTINQLSRIEEDDAKPERSKVFVSQMKGVGDIRGGRLELRRGSR